MHANSRRIVWSVASATLALAAAVPASADEVKDGEKKVAPVWLADFDSAVARAKSEKKDLLVDFTGSDWCGWCVRLHDEVFAQSDFLEAAQKQYVLVALDFPRGEEAKAKVPNATRNQELSRKYGIRGYPTVLLMNAEGEVFGHMGYEEGGSANWVGSLAKARADGLPKLTAAKEVAESVANAKEGERGAAYDRAIAALEGIQSADVGADVLARPVKAAFESDPQNKGGVRLRAAKALLKSGTADESVFAAVPELDPKNEAGLREIAVAKKTERLASIEDVKAVVKDIDHLVATGGVKDKKLAMHLYVQGMWFNHEHLKDAEKAKTYAKRVKELGIDAKDERLKQLVDTVLGAE